MQRIKPIINFKQYYINNMIEHLKSNYVISADDLAIVRGKFTGKYEKDTVHPQHWTAQYWADFIADAMELKRIN